jgi:hypothetical protein
VETRDTKSPRHAPARVWYGVLDVIFLYVERRRRDDRPGDRMYKPASYLEDGSRRVWGHVLGVTEFWPLGYSTGSVRPTQRIRAGLEGS